MEEVFFFNSHGRLLYAILHTPNNVPKKRAGIVICSSFGREKHFSHRVLVNFARFLAEAGIYTLRFDYMGEGDSEGQFEDATFESRVLDTIEAANLLKTRCQLDSIGILGVRLGGAVGLLASLRAKTDALLLWYPIFDLKGYFQNWLRANLSYQMLVNKKVIHNREALVQSLAEGNLVSVEGYCISNTFYQEAMQIDLTEYIISYKEPTLVILQEKSSHIEESPDNYAHQQWLTISEEPFWTNPARQKSYCPALFASSLQWLEGNLRWNCL